MYIANLTKLQAKKGRNGQDLSLSEGYFKYLFKNRSYLPRIGYTGCLAVGRKFLDVENNESK